MCVVLLVEIFWRNGGWRKKTPDTLFTGSFNQDTYTHTDPYLDLDFKKSVTWQGRHPKNVTWQGRHPKNVTWQGRHQKNVTWQGRHPKNVTWQGRHQKNVTWR